jgi:hypothetical protein
MLHLGLIELILDDLGSFLLPLVHNLESLLHLAVVVLHLEFVVLDPALLDLLVMLLATFFKVDLCVSFLEHVAKNHLGMESFHLVLLVVQLLIGILDSLKAFLLIVDFFFLIDTSALHLLLF